MNSRTKSHNVRIGVIGCGDWGKNHIRTLAELGVLAGVADADPARRNAVAELFGVQAWAPEDLIASAVVEGIVLALPPHQHATTALQVLGAGKHLLVEKPMSLDLAGAEAIVAAARSAGVIAMTGHLLRFHPAYEALQERIASGALGRVRYVYSTRIGLGKFFAQTDALWDIAPHDLSLLLGITAELPVRVHLEGAAMLTEAPDFAHLHMTFPSGIRSHTFISRLSPKRDRKFTVIGEAGMAVFDDLEHTDRKLAIYDHRILSKEGEIKLGNVDPEFISIGQTQPLTAELAHFIECIETGEPPRAAVSEGLDVLRILAAVDGQRGRMLAGE